MKSSLYTIYGGKAIGKSLLGLAPLTFVLGVMKMINMLLSVTLMEIACQYLSMVKIQSQTFCFSGKRSATRTMYVKLPL